MQRNLLQSLAALTAVVGILCANPAFGQDLQNWSGGSLVPEAPARAYAVDSTGGLTELTELTPASFAVASQPGQASVDSSLSVGATSDPNQIAGATAESGSMWSAYGSNFSGRGLSSTERFGNACPQCDECPTHGIVGLVGYDSFRGITDDSWQNNGIHTGFNYGTRLGKFSQMTGIGLQAGGTVGIYDWAGTDYRPANQDKAETQGFITYGLFRKSNEHSRWNAAIVQDWMINNNYGVFSQNPTLSQLRMQAGYALNAWNEIGLWGTCGTTNATSNIAGVGSTSWRAVNQINPYWHYKWGPGRADTAIWVGVPESSLSGGSLGNFVVGALANVPLGDRVGLYSLVTYLHPSASAGAAGGTEEAWNFTIGLSFYPRPNARTGTVAGQCWMPQLPVANNGYFLVNTNHH